MPKRSGMEGNGRKRGPERGNRRALEESMRHMDAFKKEIDDIVKEMTDELKKLKRVDPPTYHTVMIAFKGDLQNFLNVINHATAHDPMAQHERAEDHIDESYFFLYPTVMTNDAFPMRARLIAWLKTRPSGAGLVPLLERAQKLLPHVDDFGKPLS